MRRERRPAILFLHPAKIILQPAVVFAPAKRFVLGSAVLLLFLPALKLFAQLQRLPDFRPRRWVLAVIALIEG